MNQRFRRENRICRSRDWERILRTGQRWHGRYYSVVLASRAEDTGGVVRLGVVASRRVGCSVERNRGKRRIRELFRTSRHRFREGIDVVVILKQATVSAGYCDLKSDWDRATEQLGMLAGE